MRCASANSELSPRPTGGAAAPRRPTGVTLLEMLVVIAIIAIIAAISIGALMVIPEHARTRGTEALISKIESKLAQRLNEFNQRRDTIATLASCDTPLATAGRPELARLIATMRTMRQTFPESFDIQPGRTSDTFDNDGDILIDEADEVLAGDWNPVDIGGTAAPEQTGNELPSAALGHQAYVQRIFADNTLRNGVAFQSAHRGDTASAECLYMIVTAGGADTAEFMPGEIGDTDSDGSPEFLDKWGRPIQFFLWPTHYSSPKQKPGAETNPDDPNQLLTEWNAGTSKGWWGETMPVNTLLLRQRFEQLYFKLSDSTGSNPKAYRTYPLIISAGPDGGFGLELNSSGFIDKRAERISNSSSESLGQDLDNIDNHHLRAR